MCGIVGILGQHEAAPILLDALKRLEYRGYDSAGIATVQNGRLDRRRAVGKLVNLSDHLVHNPLPGRAGIGHTRWATHGAPSVTNAHPHQARGVAVVHNGIIENFRTLRDELEASDCVFETETDTETIALMAQRHLESGLSPVEAAFATLDRLEGAFALAFLFDGEDDLIVAARKGSPLAIGHGEGEMFLGSDALALSPMTDRVTYLEEGDRAVMTRDGVTITDVEGRRANRETRIIALDSGQVEKGGHKHFMAKEIAEQPAVLADVINHYAPDGGKSIGSELQDIDFSSFNRIIMVACGSAFLACQTAKYWIERYAGLPVEIDIASEFRYRNPPIGDQTLAIFVSQSGETADTLAALRHVKDRARILAVVNTVESSIARESDVVLPIHAGREIGVASTKALTCQMAVLALLTLKAAQDLGRMESAQLAAHLADLRLLPGLVSHVLGSEAEIKGISLEIADASDVLFLGRGQMYPIAMEGALKLKEISYIHAEGYASGELKHGPIALVDDTVPIVVLAPRDALFDKTVSNMQEVMARRGKVVLITDASGAADASDGTWKTVVMPEVPDLLAPILYTIPAQLLSYHTAVAKGTDVDQPRNLAKSVTVE